MVSGMVKPKDDEPLPPNTTGVPTPTWEAAVKVAGVGASPEVIQNVAYRLDIMALESKKYEEFVVGKSGKPKRDGSTDDADGDQSVSPVTNTFVRLLSAPIQIGSTFFSGSAVVETVQFMQSQFKDNPNAARFATTLSFTLADRDAHLDRVAHPGSQPSRGDAYLSSERLRVRDAVRKGLSDPKLSAEIMTNNFNAFMRDEGSLGPAISIDGKPASMAQVTSLLNKLAQRPRTSRNLTSHFGYHEKRTVSVASTASKASATGMVGAPAPKKQPTHMAPHAGPKPPNMADFG